LDTTKNKIISKTVGRLENFVGLANDIASQIEHDFTDDTESMWFVDVLNDFQTDVKTEISRLKKSVS